MSITDNFPPEKSSSDVGEIERKMLMASSETYLLYCATTSSSPGAEAGIFYPLWIQTSWNIHGITCVTPVSFLLYHLPSSKHATDA